MTRPLVFLDTETTGLHPSEAQVWEIAYAVDDGPILTSLVDHSPPYLDEPTLAAMRVNGYVNRWVPPADEIVRDNRKDWECHLQKALAGATLVASNPSFDAAFLSKRWRTAPWHHRMLDISAYAMGVMGWDELPGLAKIAEVCGVKQPDHTAAQDVATLRECFYRLHDVATSRAKRGAA